MKEEVRLRVERAAEIILETGATVRACALRLGVSKTTIHKDMRRRLPLLDGELSARVDAVLKRNLEERHLRGGEATRMKYRRLKAQSRKETPSTDVESVSND